MANSKPTNSQREGSKRCGVAGAILALTLALASIGCGQSEIRSESPSGPEGVEMLRQFLGQVADPDRPMPQMFGAEPAFEDAVRGNPELVEPLRPLYHKLRAAGTDVQRRKIAEEMLEKL